MPRRPCIRSRRCSLSWPSTSARRVAGRCGAGLWLAAAMPYYVTLAMFLRDRQRLRRDAIVAGTLAGAAVRLAELVVLNFTPWEWAFSRRAWFASLPSVIAVRDAALRRWRGRCRHGLGARAPGARAVGHLGHEGRGSPQHAWSFCGLRRSRERALRRRTPLGVSLSDPAHVARLGLAGRGWGVRVLWSRSSVWSRRAGTALVLTVCRARDSRRARAAGLLRRLLAPPRHRAAVDCHGPAGNRCPTRASSFGCRHILSTPRRRRRISRAPG